MLYRNDDPNDPNDQTNFQQWIKAQEIKQIPEEDPDSIDASLSRPIKKEKESTPFSEFMEAFLGG